MTPHLWCLVGAMIGSFAMSAVSFYLGVRYGAEQVRRIQQAFDESIHAMEAQQ